MCVKARRARRVCCPAGGVCVLVSAEKKRGSGEKREELTTRSSRTLRVRGICRVARGGITGEGPSGLRGGPALVAEYAKEIVVSPQLGMKVGVRGRKGK